MKETKRINIYEAKTCLSRLIREVRRTGRPVTICNRGVPVADLVPARRPADPLKPSPAIRGKAIYRYDPCAGVPEEDWPADLR